MLSFTFLCHALPIISFMGPLVNAAIYPYNDGQRALTHEVHFSHPEPVHFSRSSSQTQSTSSNSRTETHSTSVQSSFTNPPQAVPVVVRSFLLSQDGVNCQYHSFAQGPAPKGLQSSPNTVYGSPRRTLANLSPFNCNVQCLPRKSLPCLSSLSPKLNIALFIASSASPNKKDCQKIINTMWKMNQRLITIAPRMLISFALPSVIQNSLYVSYRDCAVVFENRNSQNLAVMVCHLSKERYRLKSYQWNRLAEQADRIQSQCAAPSSGVTGNGLGAPVPQTGSCFFATCDLDKAAQASSTHGRTNKAGNTGSSSPVDNSGVTISFKKNRSS
ncbi:hypothetical protein VP01_1501g1 [Puccinia sorghi]|uniref:Uncharacterized protein n=1 Tax=Puccinia sorghi TaxID=27349 RepID=A0A0L6VJ48_9BASI|nr:hypothetical protein VP01_1501g1 [Puccinia sorghi]